uniref:ATP-dependent DNA helicase n=1 Tax=Panagrellus redivivus TaxID=6233 RepID=A0A7E4V003_PANRE
MSIHKVGVKSPTLQRLTSEETKVDDFHAPLNVTDKHLEQWFNIACDIYINLTDTRGAFNTTVCVPQIIATLELFAQTAALNCRNFIRSLIFPESSSQLLFNGSLSIYLEQWENSAHEAARPGSFTMQRRILVHPTFTKSYGFETFMTLKSLGTEVKIMYGNYLTEIAEWLRRACKIDGFPEKAAPISFWQMARRDQQTVNNQKCPIFIAASHFEFPIKSNVLDCERVYTTDFTPTSGMPIKVLSCKLYCNPLSPFKSVKIGEESMMITLPTSCENLNLYVIENCDVLDMKDANQLKKYITDCDKAKPNKDVTSIFLPCFFEFPARSTNIAQCLSCAVNHMDKLFQPDAFGDLAYDGGEPSAVTSTRTASNIQHYDYLELMRLPDTNTTIDIREDDHGNAHCITRPFCVIVWDNQRRLPLYLSRIGRPDRPKAEGDPDFHGEKPAPKKQRGFFDWFKRKKKKHNNHHIPSERTTVSKTTDMQFQ